MLPKKVVSEGFQTQACDREGYVPRYFRSHLFRVLLRKHISASPYFQFNPADAWLVVVMCPTSDILKDFVACSRITLVK